jgi:chromosome segregation ATPase
MSDETETLSVRVERDKKKQLNNRPDLNVSGLVRGLLDDYLRVGDSVEVALEKRLKEKQERKKDLEMQKADLESKIQRKEWEIEDLQDKIKTRRESVPEEVVTFAERINAGTFSHEQLDTDNAALQNWADKAGLSPERFRSEVEQRL